jgi:hypothetical protein
MKELENLEEPDDVSGLTAEERILMKILQSFHKNKGTGGAN